MVVPMSRTTLLLNNKQRYQLSIRVGLISDASSRLTTLTSMVGRSLSAWTCRADSLPQTPALRSIQISMTALCPEETSSDRLMRTATAILMVSALRQMGGELLGAQTPPIFST